MLKNHLRLHHLRLAATALTALAAVITAACSGGNRGNTNATSQSNADTTAATTTSVSGAPPAASGPSEMNPTGSTAAATSGPPAVDAGNVKASLTWDAASKTMTLPIVSGLNRNYGGWNFDGQGRGSMTIVVPVGTKVTMPFYNEDIVPHSMGIVQGSATSVPSAPSQAAFSQAQSTNFQQGIATNQGDNVVFTADKPGTYLLVCGVPGHAVSGMWVVFQVSASAKAPQITTKS
jgi:sulfocyanin